MDEVVFRYFNNSLKDGSDSWRMFWAVTNHRAFDLVLASMLGLVFVCSAIINGRESWGRHAAIICTTAIIAFLATRIGHLIPVERASGTVIFKDVFYLNYWATGFETKDFSYSTFPGDHGMVALVGAGCAGRYLGRGYACAALCAGLIIVMPRLVGGAHWVSDELVGAVFAAVIALSWSFCTPLADRLTAWFGKYWQRLDARLPF